MIKIFALLFTEKIGLGVYGKNFLQMLQADISAINFFTGKLSNYYFVFVTRSGFSWLPKLRDSLRRTLVLKNSYELLATNC